MSMHAHIRLFKNNTAIVGGGIAQRRRLAAELRKSNRYLGCQIRRFTAMRSLQEKHSDGTKKPEEKFVLKAPALEELDTLLFLTENIDSEEKRTCAKRQICYLVYLTNLEDMDYFKEHGVLTKVVSYLSDRDVHRYAAPALIQLTSAKPELTEHLVNEGKLVETVMDKLPLWSELDNPIRYELLCIVANVVGRSEPFTEKFVNAGLLKSLVDICRPDIDVNIAEITSQIFAALSAYRFPDWVKNTIPLSLTCIHELFKHNNDHDVVFNCVCAVCYFTEKMEDDSLEDRKTVAEALLDLGITPRLLVLLKFNYNSVVTAALQAMENITEICSRSSEKLIQIGLLPEMKAILDSIEQPSYLQLGALRVVCHLCARPDVHFEDLLKYDFIRQVVNFLRSGMGCQQDAAGIALAKFFSTEKIDYVKELISETELLQPYGKLLSIDSPDLQRNLLLGLIRLSEIYQTDTDFGNKLEESGILEKLEKMQYSEEEEIVKYATELVDYHEKIKIADAILMSQEA